MVRPSRHALTGILHLGYTESGGCRDFIEDSDSHFPNCISRGRGSARRLQAPSTGFSNAARRPQHTGYEVHGLSGGDRAELRGSD